MQRSKENADGSSKPPALKTGSGSVRYLIGVNVRCLWYIEAYHDSQLETPWMRPCIQCELQAKINHKNFYIMFYVQKIFK